MSTTASSAFTDWLNTKLRELNTDESIFGAYILGILEGDETDEEKTDAVEGILSEILTENNLQQLVTDILSKWQECHPKIGTTSKSLSEVDVDAKLAQLLETQKLQTVQERKLTEEERKIKEQILAQYSQAEVSEEEYEDSGDEAVGANEKSTTKSSNSGLERNTNAQDVLQAQKERREQARQECAAKKQKDKEDLKKQKQMREEKKEKRKTVKGERRR